GGRRGSGSDRAWPKACAIGPALPSSERSAGRLRDERMMAVSTRPGQTTETPIGALIKRSSLYMDSESATTPCLVTSYTDMNGAVVSPAIDAVLTMWASSPPASMRGRKARTPWITPQRLTLMTQCQSASECSCAAPTPAPPALLHRTWAAPNVA